MATPHGRVKSLNARSLAFAGAAAAAVALLSPRLAVGAVYNWAGRAPTPNWSETQNWEGLAVPVSSNTTELVFRSFVAQSAPNQNIANPFVLNRLTFPADASQFHLTGQPLQFQANGTQAPTLVYNAAANEVIGNNLSLGVTTTFAGSGTGVVRLDGAVTGAGGLVVDTDGNLTFAGAASSSFDRLTIPRALRVSIDAGATVNLTSTAGVNDPNVAFSVGAQNTSAAVTIRAGGTLNTSAGSASISRGAVGVTGAGSTWSLGPQTRIGSNLRDGSLLVENGGAVTGGASSVLSVGAGFAANAAILGVTSGGTLNVGRVELGLAGTNASGVVTGAGSTWTCDELVLGAPLPSGGLGDLDVRDGGRLVVRGATTYSRATLEIEGGSFSTGSFDLRSTDPTGFAISDPTGGTMPALTIGTDNSSSTIPRGISDGRSGPGSLLKAGTGTLTLTGIYTHTGGSTASGGTLVFSGSRVLPGVSSLRADAGATIRYESGTTVAGGFLVGPGAHSIGNGVRFTGSTSLANSNLTLNGPATFRNFTNGGTLNVTQPLTWDGGINAGSGSTNVTGQLTVSSFENAGAITVVSGGTLLHNTSGALVSSGGSRIFLRPAGEITLANGSELRLNGALLINNGTINGPTIVRFNSLATGTGIYGPVFLTDNGRFTPGAAADANVFDPAVVSVAGSASLSPGAALTIELGGAAPGTGHDQVNVSTAATLAGTLETKVARGFVPQWLNTFTIMNYGSRSGRFSRYSVSGAEPNFTFVPTYESTALTLTYARYGDANVNGSVDGADFSLLASNFGGSGKDWREGDFNFDGTVDGTDFSLLASNFGSSATASLPVTAADWAVLEAFGGSVGVPVPEPTAAYACAAVGVLLMRRRRMLPDN